MAEQSREIEELENYIEFYMEIIDRYMKIVDKLKSRAQELEKTIAKQRDELERVKYERDSFKCFYDDMVNQPNCNTCTKKECKYQPKPGQITRFNCPLWEG